MQVYRIFNKINNKSYIGITKWSFNDRYPQGKWWRWTKSNHLICAIEKYGIENFDVQILNSSASNITHLLELERDYIKLYNSYIPDGYNLTHGGGSSSPTHVKEYELIDCDGNLYRVVNLSSFCKKRNINYGAMLNMVSGLSKSSYGFALSTTPIEKIERKDESWEVENINTGEMDTIKYQNIETWAFEHNLTTHQIWNFLRKRSKATTNGWKLKSTILDEFYRGKNTKYSNIKLIDSVGNEVIVNNVFRFCKEKKIYRGQMYNLIKGIALECKGYRLPCSNEEFQRKKILRYGKYIKLISPDNTLVEIKNVSDFCRRNKLNRNNIQCVIKRRIKSYKNWRLYE